MYLFLIVVLIIITAILYHMIICVKIEYNILKDNSVFIIQFETNFGLIKQILKISLNELKDYSIEKSFISDYFINVVSNELIDIDKYDSINLFNLKEITKSIFRITKDNKKILYYLLRRIQIDKLYLVISIGIGDACNTALIYGFLNILLVNCFIILKKDSNIYIEKVSLIPIFNEAILNTEFSCIIKVRLGHIITAINMF